MAEPRNPIRKREDEEASSRRADAADVRATAADVRATGADERATGADVRASAADTRSDLAIAAAHKQFADSLEPLEDKLDKSIRARNRMLAALMVLILMIGAGGYVDFLTDRREEYKTCQSRQQALMVLREVIIRATPPRVPPDPEMDARVSEFRRSLLGAVPTLTCKPPPFLPIPGIR